MTPNTSEKNKMTFLGPSASALSSESSAGRTTYVDTPPITSNTPRGVPECAIRGLRKQHSPHGCASVADILTCECGRWPMFQRSDCEGKSRVEEGCGRAGLSWTRGGRVRFVSVALFKLDQVMPPSARLGTVRPSRMPLRG